ncbi:biphenyl 2,3-dioxygenase [Photobacterium angustum]|uniref:Biphenyl 2,3-dioxygenase n=1 Tax=Photobacterium angustum TaxID=661 RepID=A0A2T3LW53_PHOAN|nr:bacteriorhodopsin-like [Photobacterium angustum]KJG02117.1 biphenyl 2,3-dioxygenase [Photobacterium angustum]KJG06116.1 biphenyl 2,3-dioxygenase [Photobacterium angustum]KJG16821.1 biphenyl 2,3-dioxygenase [Photobacterium angustum]KJG23160.1 biphenyl 2,3-dioxygenase [Photobacterium angustum]KJG30192.1 biphenyl 2,3-dioxygenase [Photobacterium angustum]
MLNPSDFVGVSFWLMSAAMMAATFFFWVERDRVVGKWKTSLSVAAMVTGIACLHYFYMRGVWVETGQSPTVFRYVDWLLTVPLQIIEFFLILVVIAVVPTSLFWRLLIASIVMLVGGYLGEVGTLSPMVGFVIGMIGWLYIIYEIFIGEASTINANSGNEASQSAFKALRLIVTIGWSIYPIGYLVGYFGDGGNVAMLNLIYNLADFVNKIAFGVVIWAAATRDADNARA